MVINLYADRMMTTPPASMYDVYDATKTHPRVYSEAAARIGLTHAQYQEFRKDLLDGKAVYIRLPKHLDSMAGVHHSQVYAVRNVSLRGDERGWEVGLSDGTQVFVPSTCGNLAMLHKPAPFRAIGAFQIRKPAPDFPLTAQPPVTEVSFAPPAPIEVAPLTVPLAAAHAVIWPWFAPLGLFALPRGGPGGGGEVPIPPCSAGSSSMGVCHVGHTADFGD
jgi:hypothetical protein